MSWARTWQSDAEMGQQRLVHVGVVVHRVLVGDGLVGEAHPEHVGRDHGESLGQRRPDRRPVPRVERIAVDQQQSGAPRAPAVDAVEDVETQVVEVLPSGLPALEFGVHRDLRQPTVVALGVSSEATRCRRQSSLTAGRRRPSAATQPVIWRAMCWSVRPTSASTSPRDACVQELLRHADVAARHVDLGAPQRARHRRPDAAVHAVVLDGDHQLVRRRQLADHLGDRQHPARVDDGHADALVAQPLGDRQRHRRRTVRPPPAARRRTARRRARRARRHRRGVRRAGMSSPTSPFGNRSAVGPVVDVERLAELLAQPGARRAARRPACRARCRGSTGPTCRCGWRRRGR